MTTFPINSVSLTLLFGFSSDTFHTHDLRSKKGLGIAGRDGKDDDTFSIENHFLTVVRVIKSGRATSDVEMGRKFQVSLYLTEKEGK